MVKPEQKRWTILLLMLIGTLVAIFFAPEESTVIEVNHRSPATPVITPSQAKITQMLSVFEEEGIANPFEKRGWEESPTQKTIPSEPAPIAPVTVVSAESEPIPPLPYKYVGRLSDETGTTIYLTSGDAALVAHVGDNLDGTYQVLAINPRSIEFEHKSSGMKQVLQIPEAE